jgi:hypothetical protein
MIIYGTKATLIGKETQFEKCTNCGAQNSVELHMFQRYAHIFWIPFFPIGKTGVSQCGQCKQVLKLKEMPDNSLRDAYNRLKKDSKTPVWTFSGLALIAVIIAIGIVNSKQEHAKNAKLVADPKKGDVYELNLGASSYTLYKVDDIVGDTVYIVQNLYETNKPSGLRELKAKPYAEDEVVPYSKAELKDLFEKDKITDVDRK